MKLSALKAYIAQIEDAAGPDTEVLFTDYSRREFPVLDFDPLAYSTPIADRTGLDGVVYIPLDRREEC